MEDLKSIRTEQRNPETMHIDELSTLDMVRLINREDHRVAEAVAHVCPQIAQAVRACRQHAGICLPGQRLRSAQSDLLIAATLAVTVQMHNRFAAPDHCAGGLCCDGMRGDHGACFTCLAG